MKPILLVDDEATVRNTLAAYLEDEGFDVVKAESGEEAVDIVTRGCRPAVCIMDMRLPGMDGRAAILALHALLPEMRAIIHTGSLSYGITEDLRAIGITRESLFHKPLQDMRVLADAVRALLAKEE